MKSKDGNCNCAVVVLGGDVIICALDECTGALWEIGRLEVIAALDPFEGFGGCDVGIFGNGMGTVTADLIFFCNLSISPRNE